MKELIRLSTQADVGFVYARMRVEDVEECEAGGHTALDALDWGYVNSIVCKTLLDPHTGEAIALTGVSPSGYEGAGKVWLLGTPGIERNTVTFLRNSKQALCELYDEAGCTVLYNYAHCNNKLHHRWLKWLGFSFLQRVELTPRNFFFEFVRLKG